MQNKNHIELFTAPSRLLRASSIRYAKKHGYTVSERFMDVLERMAVRPGVLLEGSPQPSAKQFAAYYEAAPDFALGLLTQLRKDWAKLNASNFSRLQLFMSARNSGNPNWNEQDGEIAMAYQKETARCGTPQRVSVDAVKKARKELLKRYDEIDKLQREYFSK